MHFLVLLQFSLTFVLSILLNSVHSQVGSEVKAILCVLPHPDTSCDMCDMCVHSVGSGSHTGFWYSIKSSTHWCHCQLEMVQSVSMLSLLLMLFLLLLFTSSNNYFCLCRIDHTTFCNLSPGTVQTSNFSNTVMYSFVLLCRTDHTTMEIL